MTIAVIKALLQLAKQVFLLVVEVDGRFQHYFAQQVAGGTAAYRLHAFAAQAEEFAGLGFRRDLQLHATI